MDHYQKYLESAVHFLSYRPRSEKEVRDNLQKKKAPQEIAERIIAFLTEHKFLNDEDFACWWIEQRLRVSHKSKRVIEMELKQRGVDRGIIEQAISTIQESEGVGDPETAKALVQKKIEKYKHLSRHEIYQKLGGILARRGFDWDTIKRSIDDVLNLEYNNN